MIELFFNEFLSTFPFHILAYVPFHKKLRHSPWKTFLWVCGFELGYLLLFLFLIQIGLSSVWVQYLALPCFGVLFKLIVDAESGMILFLYLSSIICWSCVPPLSASVRRSSATTFSPGRPGWLPFSSFCAVSISWQKQ